MLRPTANAAAQPVLLNINGRPFGLEIEPCVSLLDAVRDHAGLTGTKKGCDHGQCGACTVLVNGRRINSCCSLALMHEGDEITTIEGLAQGGKPAPLQAALSSTTHFSVAIARLGRSAPARRCSPRPPPAAPARHQRGRLAHAARA